MKKYLLSFVFIISLLVSSLFAEAEITSRLSDALSEASKENSSVRTLVVLKDQVDIQSLNQQLYDTEATLEERAYTVITTLQDKANSTQGALLEYLDGKYTDEVVEYRSFWITNMVFVEAIPSVIIEMAERSEIGVIDLDADLEWDKPVKREPATEKIPGGIEPGLAAINAPAMWALGFTGAGRIVMNDDTGVNGNHPALSYKWRGAQSGVPASAAWFSWNGSTTFPVDGDGHGTHTMGTMCGLDPATQDTVGVAPGAQWIASDGLWGSPHTSYSIAAWQWAVDPDGNPSTIDDMPDAIGNSWWDPNVPSASQCDPALNPYINAYLGVEAAGIAIIFSAGNSGPSGTSITSPKNVNIDEVSFWATGAVDGNTAGYPIASFSSRGPVVSACSTGTPSLDIKPEASAPGLNVRSSTGSSYASFSGTSMACPHVVGAIALLREAVPTITGWEAKMALYNTASDLGDPGEDNTYGMGIIDVYAAYVSLADPDDPNPPSDFTAFSDYSTPTSMLLNWTDPTTYFNGNPLTNFQIYVYRDGAMVATVAGGAETYTDTGLNDGQAYDYTIYAADIPNDSLSTPVVASWTAGGSAVPMEPTAFAVTNSTAGDLNAFWTNPTTQTDGTPFDDFAGVYLYENGAVLDTFTRTVGDTGVADTEVFTPTTPNAEYWVTVFDNETPQNESVASNSAYPPYSAPYLEDFENAVVGTPGTLPVQWTNESDDDFDWYVDDNGTTSTGTGPTGDHTTGSGKYMYTEATGNYPALVAHLTTPTIDISSLASPGLSFWYHMYGAAMGELHVDVYHNGMWNLDVMPALIGQQQAAQTDPWLQAIVDLSAYASSPIQVRFRGITGTSFTSDMAIDDVYFTTLSGNPTMAVTPAALADTLLVGAVDTLSLTVSNNQAAPSVLNFGIAENPEVTWLSVAPDTGSITSLQNIDVAVALDAGGLSAGTYNTQLVIAGNDTLNPSSSVDVTLVVNDAPAISISPTSFYAALESDSSFVDTLQITNNGNGPLDYTIETRESTEGLSLKFKELPKQRQFNKPVQAPVGLSNLLPSTRTISNQSDEFSPQYEDEEIAGNYNTFTPMNNNYTEDLFIFGVFGSTFSGGTRDRGNYYEMTETVQLKEHWFYLDISTSGDIYFFVYEGAAFTGTYNLIDVIHNPNSGSGEQWYMSGPTNVTLYAGNYYYIGAAWIPSATYGRGNDPVPVLAPWGSLYSGNPSTLGGAPPAASVNSTRTTPFNSQYYQALDISTAAAWLTLDPDTGTVAPMSSVDVEVTFDATGLIGGDYFADIIINSNDPLNPQVTASAQLHVTGAAGIGVNTQNVDFGTVYSGVVDTASFYVLNTGTDSLHVSGITNSTAEFTIVSPTAFSLAIADSQEVMVSFTSAMPGTYADSILITSNAANMAPTVYLDGVVADPPLIVLSDTLLQHVMNAGDEDSTTFWINNQGASPLDYELMLGDDLFTSAMDYTGQAVDPANAFNNKAESGPAVDPGLAPAHTGEAIWDVQLTFDLQAASGALGNAGAEFDGTYFYSTRWASNLIHQYDMAGNLVQEFSIAGVSGLRDLAYDGTYFYGGAAANTIYIMDFATQTLVGTITAPEGVRSIAYNEDMDAFYIANWTTDIYLVDRNGNTLSTIPAATHALTSVYGSAYDNISDGGPYLWLFHQGASGSEAHIAQIDLATGMQTGVTHDVLTDLPASSPLAGGLFITTDLVSGKATIGGCAQGTPDNMICYELTDVATWVSLDHTTGTIAPGDSGSVKVYWHGVDTVATTHSGYVGVYSNDPVTPVENVHLVLDIMTGINDGMTEALPTEYALHQNFPNPFNPSTTIKYDLKANTDVKLSIYNVLGQKVRTLVNTNQTAGVKNAVWDGLNDIGEQVASGIYIYRIEADGFVKSRKMVFMK